MSSYMKDENDFWNLLLDSSSLIVIFFFAITSETRGRIIDGAFSKHEPCFFVCILIWSTSIEWMRALSQQQNVPLFVGTRKYSLSVSPIYSGSLTIGMRFTALFPSTKSSTSNIIIDFNTNDLTIDWTWEVFECYRIHRKCLPTVTKENPNQNNTISTRWWWRRKMEGLRNMKKHTYQHWVNFSRWPFVCCVSLKFFPFAL